jgi:hypothetical protein
MRCVLRRIVVLAAFALSASLAWPVSAAPKSNLWTRWQAHDDGSAVVVDERAWASFLASYVRAGPDGINRVAYGAVSAVSRAALEADLQRLQLVPVGTLSPAEQRPYWTNLYNELTVLTILQHYPVASITKIGLTPGLFSSGGPWDAKLLRIEGEAVSLNDIEHRILRPIWRDPRTHYSLDCASIGCPNLQPVPYTRSNMEELLNRGAADYINSPRGFHVDGGKLTASSIYSWYEADFGGTASSVIHQLLMYARPEKAKSLTGITTISEYRYNWGLNDTAHE